MKREKEFNYKLRAQIMELLNDSEDGYAYQYAYFEHRLNATRKEIKREMDELRRLEFVQYVKGLMDEDGMVAGSGFSKVIRSTMTYEEYFEHLKKNYDLPDSNGLVDTPMWEVYNSELDRLFPKGKDSRRGDAMVLVSMVLAEVSKFFGVNKK